MVVVIAVAAVAVLASVVVLALGRGGELAEVRPDHPPLRLPSGRPLLGTDIALLRLPKGFWGYHASATDDALRRMAYALTERDALVALLQQRLAEVQQASDSVDPDGEESWFRAPKEPVDPRSEHAPWAAPAEFGHAGEVSDQDDGLGLLPGRDDMRGDMVDPEDR